MHAGEYLQYAHQQVTTCLVVIDRIVIADIVSLCFPPSFIVASQTPATTSLSFIKLLKGMKPKSMHES